MKLTNPLRLTTWGLSLLAVVPHIFTCVLPALAALLGSSALGAAWAQPLLNSTLGVAITKHHFSLLIVATGAAVVSLVTNLIRYQCGCGAKCTCQKDENGNCPCTTGPRGGKGSLAFSVALLLLVGASWLVFIIPGHQHHVGMMPPGMQMDPAMMGHEMPMDHAAMGHDMPMPMGEHPMDAPTPGMTPDAPPPPEAGMEPGMAPDMPMPPHDGQMKLHHM